MKRWILVCVATAVVSFAGARRAEACGGAPGDPYPGVENVAYVIGAAYAGATLGFAAADLLGKDHGITYGFSEVTLHAPIAAGFVYGSFDKRDAGDKLVLGAFALLHGALAAHGVYTMVKADAREKRAKERPKPRAALGPALVPDGAGIGYVGTF